MIGELLKQFFPALGRFLWHRTTRIFRGTEVAGSRELAIPAAPRNLGAAMTTEDIHKLSHSVGLAPDYEKLVRWPQARIGDTPVEVTSSELYKLWSGTPGGGKWIQYFPIYEALFTARRSEPLRVLEIGVFRGASLKLWRKYFNHPNTAVVGIDIEPECRNYDAPSEGIHVRIGSQVDVGFLEKVVKEFGPFDIIIDDGSHVSSHLIITFNCLFGDGLKDSGIYVAEDLHANYWADWRDSRRSFLDLCKELAEHMHAHYRVAPPTDLITYRPSNQPNAGLDVPRITTMIREMRFFDSVVAIYKARLRHVPFMAMAND